MITESLIESLSADFSTKRRKLAFWSSPLCVLLKFGQPIWLVKHTSQIAQRDFRQNQVRGPEVDNVRAISMKRSMSTLLSFKPKWG